MKNSNINPVFIIGNPRSGTTLLRLILHSNSKMVVPPEAGFALWLYDEFHNYFPEELDSFLVKMKNTKKISNWKLNWNELHNFLLKHSPKNYAELINSIYLFYGKSIGKNVERWGDKNNFYLNYIKEIKYLFPHVYFIHIIRDGRNVACSYKNINRRNIKSPDAPKFPDEISEIAKEWNKNINIIRESFKTFEFENVLEIKYEDLISFPNIVLYKITNFIDIDFENSMFEYNILKEDFGGEPEEYMQWKEKNSFPIMQEPINKYKAELTINEIEIFNKIANTNLIQYGYL